MRSVKRNSSAVWTSISSCLLFLVAIGGSFVSVSAMAAPPVENVPCILGDGFDNAATKWPNAPSNLQCTASDISLSSPVVTVFKGCDYPGDTARLQVFVDVTGTAQTRYDIGVWLSVDGDPNGDGSETGMCSVLSIPILDGSGDDILDFDGVSVDINDNQCGDVANTSADPNLIPPEADIENVDMGTVDLLCIDTDGDGNINVPLIISWAQGANTNNCQVSTDALPGSPSKCRSDTSVNVDVPVPARLIVNKDAIPDSPDGFDFLLTGADSSIVGGFDGSHPFTLFDDGITPANATFDTANEFTGGLPAGAYVLAEAALNGWFQLSASCTSDVDGLNTDPAALDLRPGETVICDFVNVPSTGELIIRKLSLGGLDSFNFDVSDTGGTVASPVLDTNVTNPVDSTTMVLESGTYDITETIPAGWSLTGASCDGGQGTFVPGDNDITGIVLNPGDSIVCTFTNAALGSVSINKVAHGGDGLFNFATSIGGGGVFDITTTNGTGSAPAVTGLAVGNYSITETGLPTGWEFVSATCVDGNGDVVDTAAVIPLGVEFSQADGQTTSCTFTNKKLGMIEIIKVTNPAGNVIDSFTFDNDAALLPATFPLMDAETQTITDVPVNDDPAITTPYTISEQDPTPGFDLTNVTCESSLGGILNASSGDFTTREASIAIRAGETVTCTFTNTQRASISVAKQISANPNGLSTLFAFTTDFDAPFNLDPDNGPADMDFTNLVPGQAYMVAETNPNAQGWALISATCGTQNEAVNLLTGVISNIIPAPGDNISCVFINAPLGSATIVKNAVGGDGVFGFTGSLEPFNNSGAGFDIDTSVQNSADFTNMLLPDVEYDVQEDSIPPNWSLTEVVCSDDTDNSFPLAADLPQDPANGVLINAAVNETVTCTFTNEAHATLIIEKVTDPNTDVTTQFAFSGTGAITGNLVGGGSVSETAPAGTFVADETPTTGWALTNITCTGVAAEKITIGGSAGFVTGDTDVSVELTPGETATCTYTNTKLGSITIEKATVGDVGAFTFMGTDVTNDAGIITSPFLLSTDLNDADPSSILYSGLLPGQYLFSETVPVGWEIDGANGDIICTGPDGFTSSWTPGSNSLDITLTNGEDLVCTFTNTRQATIIVEKTTDPTTTLQGFSFTGDVSGGPLTNGGTLMTENLSPGTYTSTETPVAGWDLTDITCDDGDSTGDTGTGIATFNAAAGEIITCTFTNTIQRGNIIVDKVTDPVGSPQVFDFTSSWAGGFGLADGTTPHNSGPLLPTSESDTYSVSEALPAGWDQTSATCDNGSDPGSIDLAPGETVTCTFTNTQRGTITLIKNLPNDSGGTAIETDFQAFIDANPVPWGIPQEFIPGDYMASETTLPGYTASGWFNACAADGSVTLGAGETLTCEITNDDDPASLVLIKRVINGTALPSDFELTLTGTDGTHDSGVTYFSGAQPPVLSGVSYTLSELAGQVPNYIDDGVACTDDVGGSAVTHPLTLNAGQSVTCTQTNRYVPLLPMIPVPVNDKLALLLLALMMLATGWYFKPAVIRKI